MRRFRGVMSGSGNGVLRMALIRAGLSDRIMIRSATLTASHRSCVMRTAVLCCLRIMALISSQTERRVW